MLLSDCESKIMLYLFSFATGGEISLLACLLINAHFVCQLISLTYYVSLAVTSALWAVA